MWIFKKRLHSPVSSTVQAAHSSLYGLTVQECVALCDEQGDGTLINRFGTVADVAKLLRVTDLKQGIQGDLEKEIQDRQLAFGENSVPDPPKKTYLGLMFEALQDVTIMILCAAAVVSLIVAFVDVSSFSACSDFNPHNHDEPTQKSSTEFVEAIAIIVAVLVVSNVTALNDYSKEKQFRKLNEASRNTAVVQVSRGGRRVDVQTQNIVVGDVLHLHTGNKVPADGITIDGQNLSCDESSQTGEPDHKPKRPGTYLKSGSIVSEGDGRMLVLAVGPNTDDGKALSILSTESSSTPLQDKLDNMANTIGKLGMTMAVLTVVSVMIRFAICRSDVNTKFKASELQILLQYLVLAVTIVVVAVPEGLPLAVTLSLAYSMKKMMEDQNLVRKLAACETMGGATNICSDKTGTLTENRMTVTDAILLGRELRPLPDSSTLKQVMELDKIGRVHFDMLLESISVNTQDSSYVQLSKSHLWEFKGNKTECALLVMCFELGGKFEVIRERCAPIRIRTLEFTSDRKRMSTVLKLSPNSIRVHSKGAAEIVIETCTKMVSENGTIVDINQANKLWCLNHIRALSQSGLRTLCISYKEMTCAANNLEAHVAGMSETELETDLILVAIVGIKDPVRSSVPMAVSACKLAGITVRMVTGDNIDTAKHIARECGILDDNGIAMEGSEFRNMSHDELVRILPRLQVLARSKPVDKYTLVKTLKELGEVVAVTGDGTNDAPALKEADVGLAMGITGTDVAKKASAIVILDDNFASIVRAVLWGRNVYDSIRKFLQFQLTVNVSALCIAYIGAVANNRTPLTPVQLLWVNLIMDTLGALALATESPTVALLKRKPHGRHDPLVNGRMWFNILSHAAMQITVLVIMLFAGESIYISSSYSTTKKQNVNYTMIFHTFVLLQVFNEINCRKLGRQMNVFQGILQSKLFMIIISITVCVQVLIVYVGKDAFQTTALTAAEFFISTAIGTLSLPTAVILKLVPDMNPKDWLRKSHKKSEQPGVEMGPVSQ